jgi:hypothetical protein
VKARRILAAANKSARTPDTQRIYFSAPHPSTANGRLLREKSPALQLFPCSLAHSAPLGAAQMNGWPARFASCARRPVCKFALQHSPGADAAAAGRIHYIYYINPKQLQLVATK